MMKARLALAVALCFSASAFAQEQTQSESQSTMKVEEATDKKNDVPGDIDNEITNKKLRAESGSKSKWSLSLDATYTGASVTRPFAADRPNLYGRPGTQTVSSLTLGPDIRYRWTKNDSVTFGTSIGMSTPLQGDINPNKNQFRVGDPGIAYSRVGKLGNLQSILGVGGSYATSPESLDINQVGTVSASWTLMRTWQNGLSLGVAFAAGNSFYSDAAQAGDDRTDYEVAAYPMMEYEFNDTFSFRTVARYTTYYHVYGDNMADRFATLPGTQSVGLGMSLGRDLYVYPNVQFDWENIRSDRTNVAVTTIVNVF